MIGLVVVSRGKLARELTAAAEPVVGPQEGLEAICIGPDDDMEKRRLDILEAASRVGGEHGAVILTDMFGGTPSNLAIAVMDKAAAEVIAGVNLPMLINFSPASFRKNADVAAAAAAAHEAGRKYINVASWVLSGEEA
jgi:PTS system mannose-specific IIA component